MFCFVLHNAGTDECDFPATSLCYRFTHPSGTSINADVNTASIWLYVLPDPAINSSTNKRAVTITRPANHYGQRTILAVQPISVLEGWVEVTIDYDRQTLAEDEQYIEIGFTEGHDRIPSMPYLSASQQPKLELDIKNHVRAARSTGRRRICQPSTTRCCMQSYTINFAEIGWDWIIEPTEYVANYCRGTCSSSGPFTFDHSQVASLKAHHIQSQNRGRSASARAASIVAADLTPCCAPERLDPLSIMYLNSNNQVTVDLLPDMIVTSCGCA